jgi:queuine tRNA-ribosyltransferase
MALRTLARSHVSHARLGVLTTKDGVVETPSFVAVATQAALKAVDLRQVPDLDCLFVNIYHLLVAGSVDVISNAGGVRSFMGTEKVIMSDSGGFQIFSLKHGTVHDELRLSPSLKMSAPRSRKNNNRILRPSDVKVTEEGVTFRSYRDGTRLFLSPEASVSAQKSISSSIIMPLDELPPYHTSSEELASSLDRTNRWMDRSLETHRRGPQTGQMCYGIIHGGSVPSLRKASVDFCVSRDFDGFAIGGALGKDAGELWNIIQYVMSGARLREVADRTDRPVHVLGIADPWNIRRLVQLGVDTFDGCFVTKISRHGTMLTGDVRNPGRLSIKAGRWKDVHDRLEGCHCPTCSQYTLAYIHHLYKARERELVSTLVSIHNLTFMTRVMQTIRDDIQRGSL